MKFKDILIFICAVGVVILVNRPVNDDLAQQQALYCEMTKTFEQTHGQYGWPDYLGIADEVCK